MIAIVGRRAARQLSEIRNYISERSPVAARQVIQRIYATIERLSEYPFSSGLPAIAETRQAIVPRLPYIVTYRVRGKRLEILGVFHAARHPSVRSRP